MQDYDLDLDLNLLESSINSRPTSMLDDKFPNIRESKPDKFLINFNYNIIKAGKKPDSLLDCISFMKYILNNNQIDNYKEEFEKLNFILSSTDILNR